uniref:Uncharacterized protein n=1 Tax=Ditylenchus dipsaci TaxID=166011 RepID=A0A915CQM8_9BILA
MPSNSKIKTQHPQLMYESKSHKVLQGGAGIPQIFYYGVSRITIVWAEQSRRDDLESLAVLMYFLRESYHGKLKAANKSRSTKDQFKEAGSFEEHFFLFRVQYFTYCRGLDSRNVPIMPTCISFSESVLQGSVTSDMMTYTTGQSLMLLLASRCTVRPRIQ